MTASETVTTVRPSKALSGAMLVVTILVVAANLRAAITSVGPVIPLIGHDTSLNAGALGVLGALPLLAFAVVSPLVHLLSRRIGVERAVLFALILLVLATTIRSLPGSSVNLWAGTALIGVAIAVCNVLVPAIVKRDFPSKIPLMTGIYSATLSAFAALASGLALPIARIGGWPWAIGIWAGISLVALACWLPRVLSLKGNRAVPAEPEPSHGSMWRSATAWQVALFMAAQSTTFYLLITWLPSIEQASGVDPVVAGWHLFLFQIAGVVAGLGVTAFMKGRADQRAIGAAVSLIMVLSMGGFLVLPDLVVLWVVLAGLSAGSALVIALTLVAQRARNSRDAGKLSGMVQSVGYLLAVLGPIGAGILFDLTGGWTATLLAVMGVGVLQLTVSFFAGREGFTHRVPAVVEQT